MDINCINCNSKEFEIIKKINSSFLKCKKCNLIKLNEEFTSNDIKNIYNQSHILQKKSKKNNNEPAQKFFCRKIQMLKKKVKDWTILDIGCGAWYFMLCAKKKGFSVKWIELDKNKVIAAQQKWLDVACDDLVNLHSNECKFDIINLWDVIEHTQDPKSVLELIKTLLVDNGYLIISLPNSNCIWVKYTMLLKKLFGIESSFLTPPEHIWYFSDVNFIQFLEERGFIILDKYYSLSEFIYELWATYEFRDRKWIIFKLIYIVPLYSIGYLWSYLWHKIGWKWNHITILAKKQ